MKLFSKLAIIGIIAGIVLAGCMKLVYALTGNEAFKLLYNVDYIPLLQAYDDSIYFGIIFHYIFCIVSVVGLYYFLALFQLHKRLFPYIFMYTVGAGILYFLTLLTNDPPAATHFVSWLYWTISHLLFGLAVALLVKKWII